MAGSGRLSPRCSTTPNTTVAARSWWRIWISPTPAPPERTPGPRRPRQTVAPHRGRLPTRRFRIRLIGMATRRGIAVIGVGPRLHQPLGCPALAQTITTTDFRPGHHYRRSRGGGRDRQTWTRLGDQATAGRAPHATADVCRHTTGQA